MNREQIQEAIENQLEDGFKGAETALGLSDKQYLPAFYLVSYCRAFNELKDASSDLDRVNNKAWNLASFLEKVSDQIGLLRSERNKYEPLTDEYVCHVFDREINCLEDEIDSTQKEADQLEDQLIELNQKYESRLYGAIDLAEICLKKGYLEEEQLRDGTRFIS